MREVAAGDRVQAAGEARSGSSRRGWSCARASALTGRTIERVTHTASATAASSARTVMIRIRRVPRGRGGARPRRPTRRRPSTSPRSACRPACSNAVSSLEQFAGEGAARAVALLDVLDGLGARERDDARLRLASAWRAPWRTRRTGARRACRRPASRAWGSSAAFSSWLALSSPAIWSCGLRGRRRGRTGAARSGPGCPWRAAGCRR